MDALDECTEGGQELVPTLLRLLLTCAARPGCPLRVLLTSRPEPHYIHEALSKSDLQPYIQTLDMQGYRESVNSDVRMLIRDCFGADERSKQWSEADPSVIDTLVKRSDGLFIYARTVVDFIMEDLSDLQRRYSLVASTLLSLDGLYSTVVESILSPQERRFPEMQEQVRRVLGYLAVLQDPDGISPTTLQNLTGMSTTESVPILNKLRSVIFFEHDNVDSPFRIVHATFREFLTNESHHGMPFFVNAGKIHSDLAQDCAQALVQFRATRWQDTVGAALILRLLTDCPPTQSEISPHLQYVKNFLRHHYEHQLPFTAQVLPVGVDNFPLTTLFAAYAGYEHSRKRCTAIQRLICVVLSQLHQTLRGSRGLVNTLQRINASTTSSKVSSTLTSEDNYVLTPRLIPARYGNSTGYSTLCCSHCSRSPSYQNPSSQP